MALGCACNPTIMKQTLSLFSLIVPIWGLFLLLHVVTPRMQTASTPPQTGGGLDGRFQIDKDGNATYTLQIQVPAGTAGMQPQLSLGSSTQLKNGLQGYGFALQGFSAISRTGATVAQDGFKSGVNYSTNDRFSLDGKRLMNINTVSGGYGGSGAQYRTEVESWTKVEAQGTCGEGPCTFEATLKTGTKATYGVDSLGGRIQAVGSRFTSTPLQGSVRQWLLNQVTDLNGNTMRIYYTDTPTDTLDQVIPNTANDGQSYPDRIRYTINDNLTPRRLVRFYYESRADTIPVYVGGGKVVNTARLARIQTFILNEDNVATPVLTYTLSYDPTAPNNISRIQTITQTAANGLSLPPTTFTWSGGPNGFITQPGTFTGVPGNYGWVGDFDGNGTTDLLTSNATYNQLDSLYLATPGGFERGKSLDYIQLAGWCPAIGDFNADGKADLITTLVNAAQIYLSNGTGFNSPQTTEHLYIPSNCSTGVWVSDFNGDGRADLLTQYGINYYLYTADSTGRGLNSGIMVQGPEITPYVYPADYNGDGMTDLFVMSSTTSGVVYYATGDTQGFATPGVEANNLQIDNNVLWVGDFNGDGLGDLFSQSGTNGYVSYATGYGFEPSIPMPGIIMGNTGNWIGDFNGDGMTDFYVNSASSGTVFFSIGTGFRQANKVNNTDLTTQNAWLGDFNGDGTSDLFNVGVTPTFQISGNTEAAYTNVNHTPNLLTGIDNGYGGTFATTYQPITDTTIYKPAAPSADLREGIGFFNQYLPTPLSSIKTPLYPIAQVQNAMYVATRYTKSNGLGATYAYDFRYRGAKMDLSGYGWLGFASRIQIDSSAQQQNVTTYAQPFPLTGSIDSSVVFSLQNARLKRYRINYVTVPQTYPTKATVYAVNHSQTRTDHFDYGIFRYTTGRNYSYDNFGNVKLLSELGDTAATNRYTYTLRTYDNDTTHWQLGYPTLVHLSSSTTGADTLQLLKMSYDSLTKNILRKQYWDDSEHDWLDTSYVYDPYGNTIHTIATSQDTTTVTFDTTYQTYPVERLTPRNQWGNRLRYTYGFNAAFGLMTETQDPNGSIQRTYLDGFGRDSLQVGPDTTGLLVPLTKTFYHLTSPGGYVQTYVNRQDWAGTSWDTTHTYYDGLLRTYQTETKGQSNLPIYTQKVFTGNDKVLAVSQPYFADSTIYWTRLSYDPYERINRIALPQTASDSIIYQLSYEDLSVTLRKAVGTPDSTHATYTYGYYNGKRALYTHTDPNNHTTTFDYDLLGRMQQAIDPKGIVSTLIYNSLSRQIRSQDPSFQTTHYHYDDTERKVRVVNTNQDTLVYTYDGLGRQTTQQLSPSETITFQYDLADHTRSQGRLSKVLMQDGMTYDYTYTWGGARDSIWLTINDQAYLHIQTYNPNQTPATLTYPDGSVQRNTYTAQALPESVLLQDANASASAFTTLQTYTAFDAAGHTQQSQYGNDLTLTQSYLPMGNLASQQLTNLSNIDLFHYIYHWNYADQIDTLQNVVNSAETQRFTYDKANQLLNAQGVYGTKNYTYDSAGNMTLKDGVTYTYQDYQVQHGIQNSDTVFVATYDDVGNMKSRWGIQRGDTTHLAFGYDMLQRLTDVVQNGDSLYQFAYDYLGRRVKKRDIANNTTTWYISAQYEVTQYPDSTTTTKNILGPTGLIATVSYTAASDVAQASPTRTLYFHTDRLSNTLLTTTASGQTSAQLAYMPYGQVYVPASTGPDDFRYKFGGKELDEASGLYYFNARFYDPIVGRFITADTQLGGSLIQPSVFNRYAYTLNNPIRYADPSGHGPLLDVLMLFADVIIQEGVEELATTVAAAVADGSTDVASAVEASTDDEMARFQIKELEKRGFFDGNLVDLGDSGDKTLTKIASSVKETRLFPNRDANVWTADVIEAAKNMTAMKPLDDGTLGPLGWWPYEYNDPQFDDMIKSGTPFKWVMREDGSIVMNVQGQNVAHAILAGGKDARVISAGWGKYEKGVLRLNNRTGHFQTSYASLKKAKKAWKHLGYKTVKIYKFNDWMPYD